MNRRKFIQALGVLGIGGVLPVRAERNNLKGRRLYCEKAGVNAELIEIALSRPPIECNPNMPFDDARYFYPGSITLDCEIKPINMKRGKLEWCMFNVAEWVVVLSNRTDCSIKGFLTHYSYNADAYNTDRDTMSLTIQEA